MDDRLSVSRVGFSPDGGTALFFVSSLTHSPGTTHLVLLTRRDGRWRVRCALLDNMLIF